MKLKKRLFINFTNSLFQNTKIFVFHSKNSDSVITGSSSSLRLQRLSLRFFSGVISMDRFKLSLRLEKHCSFTTSFSFLKNNSVVLVVFKNLILCHKIPTIILGLDLISNIFFLKKSLQNTKILSLNVKEKF